MGKSLIAIGEESKEELFQLQTHRCQGGQNKMLKKNTLMMKIQNLEEVKGSVKGKMNYRLLSIKISPKKGM